VWLSLAALRFPADSSVKLEPVSLETLHARAPKVVSKPETMNYRTLMPEPGGLFDPKLFGPGTVIDAPLPSADEPIKPRKTHFARIPLAVPIVHPLLIAHAPDEVRALAKMDVSNTTTDVDVGRKVVEALSSKSNEGALLRELPVLPPDLRALRRDEEDRWLSTPLNAWYQRVLNRNARLQMLTVAKAPSELINPEYTELQVAIRGLFENDELPDPARDKTGEALPSLISLCGGTKGLHAVVEDLAAHQAADDTLPGRLYLARAVLFALGFELRA
jgi:DNA-directed RNA polymerase beta' subunit